jgi:hypothetical protein
MGVSKIVEHINAEVRRQMLHSPLCDRRLSLWPILGDAGQEMRDIHIVQKEKVTSSRLGLLIVREDSGCGTETVEVSKLDPIQIGFSAVMANFDLRGHWQQIVVIVDRDIVVVHTDRSRIQA